MGNTAPSQQLLTITIQEGQTQSQELYDYHSSKVNSQTNSLIFPSLIGSSLQDSNSKILYSQILNPEQSQSVSAHFRFSMGNYRQILLESQSNNYDQVNVWKVIKENQLIEEGDILKIGKVKLIVKQIAINKKKQGQFQRQHTEHNQSKTNKERSISGSVVSKQQQCRVCFQSEDTTENPLICLCKCSGSVKFIHFSCLKDWISDKIVKKEAPNCINYSYYKNQCQICKQQMQNEFIHNGKKYTLFSTQNIPEPYVRLQGQEVDLNGKKKLSVYLIRLIQNTQIVIGRNNVSDVTMKDISVSRTHCSLFFKNRMLFLNDKKSKFGTLLKMKDEIQFNTIQGLQLQYQSRLIKIGQERVINNCCCAQSDTYKIKLKNSKSQKNKFQNSYEEQEVEKYSSLKMKNMIQQKN